MEEKQSPAPDTQHAPRRAWEAPSVEELDFNATEAAYIPGAPNDLGIYSV